MFVEGKQSLLKRAWVFAAQGSAGEGSHRGYSLLATMTHKPPFTNVKLLYKDDTVPVRGWVIENP